MLIEDWIFFGLLSGGVLIFLIIKAVEFWLRYLLMKDQLASAVACVRLGHTVTRKFAKMAANTEMTGERQSLTVTPEFADTLYKIDKRLEEALELLNKTPS